MKATAAYARCPPQRQRNDRPVAILSAAFREGSNHTALPGSWCQAGVGHLVSASAIRSKATLVTEEKKEETIHRKRNLTIAIVRFELLCSIPRARSPQSIPPPVNQYLFPVLPTRQSYPESCLSSVDKDRSNLYQIVCDPAGGRLLPCHMR